MNPFRKIYSILTKDNKRDSIIFFLLLVFATVFEILSIGLIFPAITILLKSELPENLNFIHISLEELSNYTNIDYITLGLSILILVFLVKNIFLLYYFWWKNGYSNEVQKQLSQRLLLTYLRQPYALHLQRNSSELVRNLVSEVSTFQKTFQSILELIFELFVLTSIIVLLFITEPKGLSIIVLIISTISLIIYLFTYKRIKIWGKIRLSESNKYFQNVSQAIGSLRDIILTGRENNFLYNHFSQKSILTKLQQKFAIITIMPRFLFEFFAVFAILSLTIFFISEGKSYDTILPLVGLFAMAGYRLMPSVTRILVAIQSLKFRVISIDMLYKEIHIKNLNNRPIKNEFFIPSKISDDQSESYKNIFNNEIKIQNLNYGYDNTKISTIKNINLIIKKGQSIGIFGPSGSGKSTLISLILGLLTPTAGSIKIDNIEIGNRLIPWQRNIGYVPQSVYLTDDTIAQNIAFGISKERININKLERAIESSQLKEFISSLKDGIETIVGENGVRLSGGQIQRIGIARALYNDPSVVVFDEATSSLDYDTERELMKDINKLKEEKTLIIIAHRLSTVDKCDFVIKIQSGEIVEQGKPDIIFKK
tara:strand:- start:424 stop:2211 length:1788 start_codon:yes stop_codon:yes gene_type:complete